MSEHDEMCEQKWRERKKDLKEWMCLKLKPTAGKQAMMWGIMLLMLSTSITAAWKTVSVAGGQQAIDVAQDKELVHHEERLDIITKAHEALVENTEKTTEQVQKIRETQIKVQVNQANMIKMLERIEANVR